MRVCIVAEVARRKHAPDISTVCKSRRYRSLNRLRSFVSAGQLSRLRPDRLPYRYSSASPPCLADKAARYQQFGARPLPYTRRHRASGRPAILPAWGWVSGPETCPPSAQHTTTWPSKRGLPRLWLAQIFSCVDAPNSNLSLNLPPVISRQSSSVSMASQCLSGSL